MSDEDSDHSFCFDCARSIDSDTIISVPALNPWPGLVKPTLISHLRCQPLVRLVYTPRSLDTFFPYSLKHPVAPDRSPVPEEIAAFRDGWSLAHEYAHFLVMDRTPAKELARVHLAYAYDLIGFLVRSLDESRDYLRLVFDRFQAVNRVVGSIGRRIAFVEELLATAIALEMVEASVAPGRVWQGFDEEFTRLRDEVLRAHDDVVPGFARIYGQVTALLRGVPGGTAKFSLILPVVQAVRHDDDNRELLALDGRDQLELLFDLLADVGTAEEIAQRLEPLRGEIDEGWKLAVMLQQDNANEPEIREHGRSMLYGMIAASLLRISRGDLIYQHAMNGEGASIQLGRTGPLGFVVLRPACYRRRWGLERTILSGDGNDLATDLERAYSTLSYWESWRQQLGAREGIVCPRNPYGLRRCQCGAKLRRAIHGLARLAQDNVFGEGNWSFPVCRA